MGCTSSKPKPPQAAAKDEIPKEVQREEIVESPVVNSKRATALFSRGDSQADEIPIIVEDNEIPQENKSAVPPPLPPAKPNKPVSPVVEESVEIEVEHEIQENKAAEAVKEETPRTLEKEEPL